MQLEYTVKLMGAEHVIYSVDYPYVKPENANEFLTDAEFLSSEEKELIAHKNAERIFHL